jgi:transposase-like protein
MATARGRPDTRSEVPPWSPSSWRTPPKTSWLTCTSLVSTDAACIRRTRSSACTRRSSVGTHVVGIFPTRDSLMRMVGWLVAEQDDEWQVSDRRYFSLGSMTKIDALEE